MTITSELANRWQRALRAAMRAAVPSVPDDATDQELMVQALERAADATLRGVFDVSLRLGGSFRNFHRVELPLADVVRMLPALGPPCTSREWLPIAGEPAQRAERAPCEVWSTHPRACELWREAINGLVLGLTGEIRFARHASRGAGDPRCVDVLHVHPQSPLRFGPIPDDLHAGLDAVRRTARAFDGTLEIDFLGLSEGVLYYRAQRPGGVGAGDVTTSVDAHLRRRFPTLATREISPRAVITPDGS